MKKIGITIAGLVFGILFTVGVQGHAETTNTVVYTGYTESGAIGDGTKENPYNRFEDALEHVADGGTIYIVNGMNGYINDQSNNMPLLITKNITIKPEPGTDSATLSSRAAGIVLGADVTFENISLGFANAYHDQIFANGHTLILKNVSRESGCRLVDLAAGTICDTEGKPLVGYEGTESKIIVEEKGSFIGNIYAGSINGTWDKNVSIQTKNISNGQIGEIYGSGAKEAQVNLDDWFSMSEPPAPVADASVYPVNGQVCISIEDTAITLIDGAGASEGTQLKCSTTYLNSYTHMRNLNVLNIKSGCFMPPELTFTGSSTEILVSPGGTIDFSKVGDFEIENFTGGGTIIVGEQNCFTISKSATGTSAFEVEGGMNGVSGWAEEDHTYIVAPKVSSAEFTFIPYYTQEDVELQRQEDGSWKIVSNGKIYIGYYVGDGRGNVQDYWEFVHPTEGTAVGTVAIPDTGYHFVSWTDEDGNVVGTDAKFIPPKTNGSYVEAYYYANFAEGEANPTPTPSKLPIESPTPTVSPTLTISPTPTASPALTESPTPTVSPALTVSPTPTISSNPLESQEPLASEMPTPTFETTASISPNPTERVETTKDPNGLVEIPIGTINPTVSGLPEILDTANPLPTESIVTTKEPANPDEVPMASIVPTLPGIQEPIESGSPLPTDSQKPIVSESPLPTFGIGAENQVTPNPTEDIEATKKPGETVLGPTIRPTTSPEKINEKKCKNGQIYKSEKTGNKYKILSVKNKTVAFIGNQNKKIKNITIPNTVTILKVKYKVTQIAEKALSNYKKLQKVTIGKNVKKIGAKAFYKCTALKTVILQSTSITSIGEKVFYGDKKLTALTLNATNLTSKKVGGNIFSGTSKALVVKVPSKKVDAYNKILRNCGNKSLVVKKKS